MLFSKKRTMDENTDDTKHPTFEHISEICLDYESLPPELKHFIQKKVRIETELSVMEYSKRKSEIEFTDQQKERLKDISLFEIEQLRLAHRKSNQDSVALLTNVLLVTVSDDNMETTSHWAEDAANAISAKLLQLINRL